VSEIHWCGARDWNQPQIKIDLTIKNQFKAGSDPTAIRIAVSELLKSRYANHTVRFSDGSLALGRVGIGIFGSDLVTCYRRPDQCKVFSAEVAATTPSDRPITIFTDSYSVVTALKSENPKHPWIQKIQLDTPADTTFVWIPSHSGIPGNEEADHLAGSGRRMALFTKQVPAADIKSWVTKLLYEKWAQSWFFKERDGAREYFLRKIKADVERWEDPKKHRDQIILSRLRTGYALFAYNMGGQGNFRIICTVCRIHHSVEHVICHCSQYEGPRKQYAIPGSIRQASKDDASMTAAIILFLKDSKLYNQT
jgi:hypothetical protein